MLDMQMASVLPIHTDFMPKVMDRGVRFKNLPKHKAIASRTCYTEPAVLNCPTLNGRKTGKSLSLTVLAH